MSCDYSDILKDVDIWRLYWVNPLTRKTVIHCKNQAATTHHSPYVAQTTLTGVSLNPTCISSSPSSFSLFSADRFLSDSSRESRPESVSASRPGWWLLLLLLLLEEEVGAVPVCTLVLGDSRDSSQLSGWSWSSGLQRSVLSSHHYQSK